MDLVQALRVFEKKEGFFQDNAELKSVFRKLSMQRHPDCGGSETAFIELTSAYEFLFEKIKELGINTSISDRTIEGDLVVSLGKGFPTTEIDVGSCDVCSGKGYHIYHDKGQVLGTGECPTCNGVGLFSYDCRYCKGTGKYRKSEHHAEIECKVCNGSGRFYPINKFCDVNFKENVTMQDIESYIMSRDKTQWMSFTELLSYNKLRIKKWYRMKIIPGKNKIGVACKTCHGSGQVEIRSDDKPYYSTCYNCKGLGEVKLNLWNPVLRRGVMKGNR
jgi:DnaJ-class molecular chaperone